MDLSSHRFIKEEKDFTYIEDNLDFNFDVKIEEIPLVGDWCITNGDALEKNQNREDSVVVSYAKLKDGCLQKCFRCFQWVSDSFELIKHNLTHLEITTKKLELPKIYQKYKSNKRTYNKKTKNDDTLKCTKCDTSFKRRKDLNKHIKYIHEPTEVTCNLCPTKLTNKDALKTHKRNCHTKKVYCDICKSKLKSMSYLHAHMRRVHYDDGKVHSCDICDKIFKSPRYLKIHQKNCHKVVSNKAVRGSGRRKKQIKLEPESTEPLPNTNELDRVPVKIEYEETISYEIEMPYEIALS